MVYQFKSDMLPDTYFHLGSLKYIVPGNEGRLLDPRRTPVRVLDMKRKSGFFVLEVLDFEDKGALWKLPLENADHLQFDSESTEACAADIELYAEIISRLDQPLTIPADPRCQMESENNIASLRKDVRVWLETNSEVLESRVQLDFSRRVGSPLCGVILSAT